MPAITANLAAEKYMMMQRARQDRDLGASFTELRTPMRASIIHADGIFSRNGARWLLGLTDNSSSRSI
jgi:hypothetical protein